MTAPIPMAPAVAGAPQPNDFQLLPILPQEGFPQAFLLSFGDKLYRFTFSVSFLTLAPFKLWVDGSTLAADAMVQRALGLPTSVIGARPPLPGDLGTTPERAIYELPQETLYLVMRLEREDFPPEQRLLGITRAVRGIPFRIGDLVFLFQRIRIARGNLLGPGDFGSEIVAGVMPYGR